MRTSYMNYIILTLTFLLFSSCIQQIEKPQNTYFSDTIVVWDSSQDVYHKLMFHTVYLENSTLSGFSLNTFQIETFHISDDSREQFDLMKQLDDVNKSEVKCVKCHPSVAKR